MPAYVIGQIHIRDRAAYQAYLDGFSPSFERHGGVLLAGSAQATQVLEGTWAHPCTVVLRFPDAAAARAWYADPDYQAIVGVRWANAETNLVIVDGADGEGL